MKQKYLNPVIFFFVSGIILLALSCNNQGNTKRVIPASKRPEVSIKIKRYGKALFEADTSRFKEELYQLQKEFPFFLAGNLEDTANYNQLYTYVTDTQIIRIYHQTMEQYPDIGILEKSLSEAFSYVKYYFPGYEVPHVYTYVSDIYYEQPVLKRDSVLAIALDDYLGAGYPDYAALDIPRYKTRCMTGVNIVPDVMKTVYAMDFYSGLRTRTLLDRMIEHGKQLWFLDLTLPEIPDSLKICYTSKQWQWMVENKQEAWSSLIANKLLFTTDFKAIRELTEPGPFTKGFGNNSAPAIAAWFGWQIVRSYMDHHPETKPGQLFRMTDSQKMLEQSGYKP